MSTKDTLLLVGRSGNGKSSVGNTLLGKKFFEKKQGSTLSNHINENHEFTVVDCSGVGDTGSDIAGSIKSVLLTAKNGVRHIDGDVGDEGDVVEDTYDMCHDVSNLAPREVIGNVTVDKTGGFDALIFVMKYGVRFTKQEKDAVQIVKLIFGENIFRDWGILVFSHGDNFKIDSEDSKVDFLDWCKEQTCDIKLLFEETQYRCVIFNNIDGSNDPELKNLKDYIQQIKTKRRPYSLTDFDNAEKGHASLKIKYENETIEKKTKLLLTMATQSLEQSPPDHEHIQQLLNDMMRIIQDMSEKCPDTRLHVDAQKEQLEAKIKQLKEIVEDGSILENLNDFVRKHIWSCINGIRLFFIERLMANSVQPNHDTNNF